MQVYDPTGNIREAMTGTLEELEKKKKEELKKPDVAKVVIGKMPEEDQLFNIGKLVFAVTSVKTRGRITAKIVGKIRERG